jgi:hypothetical protein
MQAKKRKGIATLFTIGGLALSIYNSYLDYTVLSFKPTCETMPDDDMFADPSTWCPTDWVCDGEDPGFSGALLNVARWDIFLDVTVSIIALFVAFGKKIPHVEQISLLTMCISFVMWETQKGERCDCEDVCIGDTPDALGNTYEDLDLDTWSWCMSITPQGFARYECKKIYEHWWPSLLELIWRIIYFLLVVFGFSESFASEVESSGMSISEGEMPTPGGFL